jgi:hypothetical protein
VAVACYQGAYAGFPRAACYQGDVCRCHDIFKW